MKIFGFAITAAALLLSLPATVQAQTTLRIGLAEDPDILDPTMARTYVGRIVFASFCDKLFDIDEKLNIVPQLALSHETSADGKEVTIKLRPGVKFHDGEAFTAEAAKFSLERHLTFPGSFRKPELAAVDHIDVVDPLTIKLALKAPFSPLIAQLTDRAGMMVSPKAVKDQGDKFGLRPVCAGPYKFVERVQQDRVVFEKFADYWNKDNVHIDRIVYLPLVDATVRLANLKSGGLDLIERVLATDLKEVQSDSKLKLSSAIELGYQGVTLNVGKDKAKGPLPVRQGPTGARPLARPRRDQPGGVQRRVQTRKPVGQPRSSLLPKGLSGAEARRRQGQGIVEGSRRHAAGQRGLHGVERRGNRSGIPGDPGDGGGGRFRHEAQGHRVRDVAEAGGGRRIPGLSAGLERADRSGRQFLRLPEVRRAA